MLGNNYHASGSASAVPTFVHPAELFHGPIVTPRAAITYSSSMTPNAAAGNAQVITATNRSAFTINAPTNPITGQEMTITIRNTSGGTLGAATWNAVFKLAPWANPANDHSRSITFRYDGTNWIETARTPNDVPN
jgi:hypothetical protein